MKGNIDELIKELSLKEKASLLSGGDVWQTEAVARLDIPAILSLIHISEPTRPY